MCVCVYIGKKKKKKGKKRAHGHYLYRFFPCLCKRIYPTNRNPIERNTLIHASVGLCNTLKMLPFKMRHEEKGVYVSPGHTLKQLM